MIWFILGWLVSIILSLLIVNQGSGRVSLADVIMAVLSGPFGVFGQLFAWLFIYGSDVVIYKRKR